MTSDNLLDIIAVDRTRADRVYGVVVGIVTNNDDPEHLGRVRVRFPWLSADHESWWARTATPMAGAGRGIQFPPEVDDEVLIAFEHGNVDRPYVLGAMWNGADAPPEPMPLGSDKRIDRRVIRTRSGHLIRFRDTDGAERIEILDRTGNNTIVIDSAANQVSVHADGDILLRSANGKVEISGPAVEISSTRQDIRVTSAAGMTLSARGTSTITGATVSIN